jgi:glycosyltransferase involved in cell wall biosynthesis
MIEHVSAVIIVKNAESTLKETLESLKDFREVVLYDNGSTDGTLALGALYSNVIIFEGKFEGFGKTKQAAVACSSNDWVLSLDADEMVTPELAEYLESWDPSQDSTIAVKVLRKNFLMGKWVKYAGWGGDWLVRLFNRDAHNFNDNDVHESIKLHSGSFVKKIPHAIEHNAVQELGQFLQKVDRYTEINRQSGKTYPPSIILLKAIWRFLESYILKGGFLAGWRGLAISWSNANGVFYKYMKPYGDQHKD